MEQEKEQKVFVSKELSDEEMAELDKKLANLRQTSGNMVITEPVILGNEQDIEKAERLCLRVAFSIYYRKANISNYEKELKALDKIKRFLTNDSNKKYLEESTMWKGTLSTVDQRHAEYEKAIAKGKAVDEAEVRFLEELKANTYGEKQYNADYFTKLFAYAEVNGDTNEFDWQLKELMKAHGFIKEEEKVEPKEEESKE